MIRIPAINAKVHAIMWVTMGWTASVSLSTTGQ